VGEYAATGAQEVKTVLVAGVLLVCAIVVPQQNAAAHDTAIRLIRPSFLHFNFFCIAYLIIIQMVKLLMFSGDADASSSRVCETLCYARNELSFL